MCLQSSLIFSFLKAVVLSSLLAQSFYEIAREAEKSASYREDYVQGPIFVISDDDRRRASKEDSYEEDEIRKTQTKSKDE